MKINISHTCLWINQANFLLTSQKEQEKENPRCSKEEYLVWNLINVKKFVWFWNHWFVVEWSYYSYFHARAWSLYYWSCYEPIGWALIKQDTERRSTACSHHAWLGFSIGSPLQQEEVAIQCALLSLRTRRPFSEHDHNDSKEELNSKKNALSSETFMAFISSRSLKTGQLYCTYWEKISAHRANITDTLKRRLLNVIKDHGTPVATERLIQWVNLFRKLERYNLHHRKPDVSSNLLGHKTAIKNPSFGGCTRALKWTIIKIWEHFWKHFHSF